MIEWIQRKKLGMYFNGQHRNNDFCDWKSLKELSVDEAL